MYEEKGTNVGSINQWYVFLNKDMEAVRGVIERGLAVAIFYEQEIKEGDSMPGIKFYSQPPLLIHGGYLEDFVERYKDILDKHSYKCYPLLIGKEFNFREDRGFKYLYKKEMHR